MSRYHTTVLLQEAVDALEITPTKKYIDATLGGGGHTFEIAEKGGIVLGIDQDADAIAFVAQEAKSKNQEIRERITLAHGNFANIGTIAKQYGFENVAGILFDIGVSGHQFADQQRGFSLIAEGPLDMRMSQEQSVTAADLVNGLTKGELQELFVKYGEEPFAKKIAEVIVGKRLEKPIQTTTELADIIAKNVRKIGKIHPATRVFQALRIAVNDELHSLEDALPQAVSLLQTNGKLVVISFHSLEDRIVKNTFESFVKSGLGSIKTKKPMIPTDQEVASNKKARSAKMRVFVKA